MRAILLLLAVIPFMSLAQKDTIKVPVIQLDKKDQKKMEFAGVYKSAVGVELGGKSGYIGITYDHLLSRRWRLGLGVGYPGFGGEVKCFPFGVKRDKLLFNVGARATALFPAKGTNYMFYSIPIGLSYFTVNRMNVELDAGPLFKEPFDSSVPATGFGSEIDYVWFSLKLSYRFSFYAMRRAKQLDAID
jgi:hypothetical protein